MKKNYLIKKILVTVKKRMYTIHNSSLKENAFYYTFFIIVHRYKKNLNYSNFYITY